MKDFQDFLALNLLAGAVVLYATCGPAAGQVGQRGMSSRGVNAVGSRNSVPRRAAPPVTTGPLNNGAIYGANAGGSGPLNNGAIYGGNAGGSGPLNFGYAPFFAGPGFYIDPSTATLGGGEMSSQGDLGSPSALPSNSSRPSIRPRLNISDPDAMNRRGVLPSIRNTILEQLAQVAEKPFTAPWYAAHPSVVPVSVEGDNPWRTSNWKEASQWLSMDAEPLRYDYRPDKNGLIFVYRNEAREGRAVDARKPAVQLAGSSAPVADEPPGLSLGIFAAVSPVDEPVQSSVAPGRRQVGSCVRLPVRSRHRLGAAGGGSPGSCDTAHGLEGRQRRGGNGAQESHRRRGPGTRLPRRRLDATVDPDADPRIDGTSATTGPAVKHIRKLPIRCLSVSHRPVDVSGFNSSWKRQRYTWRFPRGLSTTSVDTKSEDILGASPVVSQ